MGFYYATEKAKFNAKWKTLEKWYRESGMSEEAIREMREYDWSEFNSTRKFYRCRGDDVDIENIANDDDNFVDKAFSEEWIELLDTPELVLKLRKLPADNELCVRANPDVRQDHHYDASDGR